jgi:hypothetical protein
MSLGRTSTALGAFYRRLAARVGKAKAITATARKLAVLVYRVLSGDLIYNDPGATAYQQLNRARELKSLSKRATLLGFELVDRSSGEVLLNPVSQEEPQLIVSAQAVMEPDYVFARNFREPSHCPNDKRRVL